MSDRWDRADRTESTEPADPMEPMEKKEPMEAIEHADPIEPIDRTDPLEPIERNESSDHSDHRDAAPVLCVMHPSCLLRSGPAGGTVRRLGRRARLFPRPTRDLAYRVKVGVRFRPRVLLGDPGAEREVRLH